jgi:hypothetical protein
MEERRVAHRILMGRPEGRRPHGRPRHRWVDNTKMDLKRSEMGAYTGLMWLRIGAVGGPECGNEPSISTHCGELLD